MLRVLLLAVTLTTYAAHGFPSYSAASVVNAATGEPLLAPNCLASLYGRELAYTTRVLQSSDLEGNLLPVHLPGTGVRVFLDGLAAPITYVSPTQVNFLVPPNLLPGREATLWLAVDGKHGPEIRVRIGAFSPGLFQLDPETALAVTLSGAVLRRESPARPNQDIVLFATGLGPVSPSVGYRELVARPSPLAGSAPLEVLLDGAPVAPERIRYAGAAPGFAGLYQINLWLPPDAPSLPLLQLRLGTVISPPGVRLPLIR